MVKRIGLFPFGLRRGHNHDVPCASPYIEDLTNYFLVLDRTYQRLKRAEKYAKIASAEVMNHRRIVTKIVQKWFDEGRIFYLNNGWILSVTFTDYIIATSPVLGRTARRRVKNDDRSFHGRPRRDRVRMKQAA